MRQRGVAYDHLDAGRYVGGMRQLVRTHEPARLMDTLIIGAFVEARSCERFELLIPHLDSSLGQVLCLVIKVRSKALPRLFEP